MESYQGIKVYTSTDEEIVTMLETGEPKFIIFVEDPKVLSKYFTKVSDTLSKLLSGYYNTEVKKENVFIIKTEKEVMEEVLMEELDKPPVGIFCPTPGQFYVITF